MSKYYFSVIIIFLATTTWADSLTVNIYYESSETATQFEIKNAVINSHELKLNGNIVSAKTWVDKIGRNMLILTQTGVIKSDLESDEKSAELYVYHYILDDNKYKLVRKLHDFVRNCLFDIYVGFLENSLTITDLNEDEIAEITIVYKLTCRSDITPSQMKLILLENGEKFALRGYMINEYVLHLPEEKQKIEIETNDWGAYKIDPSFTNAPKELLKYSIKRWEQLKANDQFIQMN